MNQVQDKKIVAISGFARSGKNSFADEIQKQLKDVAPNLVVEQFSFAASLRVDLDSFLKEKFDISSWTEDEKEKEIIRPLLIAYGNSKRKQTKNQYWIERLHKKIEQSKCDVALITDLRYAEDEDDELGWLKKNRGFNFHLKRYRIRIGENTEIDKTKFKQSKRYENAPNDHEKVNNPKLEANAKKVIELPRFKTLEEFQDAVKVEVEKIIGYFL